MQLNLFTITVATSLVFKKNLISSNQLEMELVYDVKESRSIRFGKHEFFLLLKLLALIENAVLIFDMSMMTFPLIFTDDVWKEI